MNIYCVHYRDEIHVGDGFYIVIIKTNAQYMKKF